jgi:antitoxin (DNA-binding transcriptional repressor) of toxin-antitoxin stability system
MSMTTLTPTAARANLSALLRLALKGHDIGIVIEGKIIALRPVAVESADYATREYGVTETELASFEKHIHEKIAKERQAGRLREFKGDLEALVARKNHR